MAFHNADRLVYEKLVINGTHVGLARDIVCLLIWLDQTTTIDLPHNILAIRNPSTMVSVVAEGEAILHYVQQDDNANSSIEFPCLTKLLKRRIDTNFIDNEKEKILKSLTDKINGIGRVIFEDYYYEILHAYETNVRLADQDASRWGRIAMPPVYPTELIRPYHLTLELATPADDQSMFINSLGEGFMDYFA